MFITRKRISEGSGRSEVLDREQNIDITRVEQALGPYQPGEMRGAHIQRWAGVAAILRDTPKDGAGVLVIRRSEHPNDPWSGHMAMPGGRQDPQDETTRHTAERETLEEVGIDLTSCGRLLGRLDDVSAVARGRQLDMAIRPFVYAIETEPELALNHEVQETHWVPLADLAGPVYRSTKRYEMGSTELLLPCWNWNERVIWGLTYNMLSSMLRLIERADT